MSNDSVAPHIHERRWWILSVLCLSLLIVMLANTSLNVALPTLARELGTTNSQLQWLVDAYSLVFAGFLFLTGALGDKYGRKTVLQVGLVLFAATSLYAAMGVDTAGELIATRAVMGLAGALVMPSTLSILTNVFSRAERPKAVATWAGISGAGVALGPLLSGFMIENTSWHGVFLINLPFIALALIAGFVLVPNSSDPSHARFDIAGAVLSVIGLVSLVYAIIEAPVHGWLSLETLATFGFSVVVLAAFAWWELRAKNPMLDVRLFKNPAFGISSLVLTLVFFALMGMFFNMSQLMQLVYGYGAFESALRMLPISFVVVLIAPRSPKVVERFGKRRVVAGGMLLIACGVALLSTLTVDPNYGRLLLCMVLTAAGMALAMSPTTDLLMSSVPRARAGMGSAMNDTTRELGGSLGVAILGSLLASRYSHKIAEAVVALPETARTVAESSLAGALRVASQAGQFGPAISSAAKSAWMDGFTFSLLTGAVIIAASAAIAFLWLPDAGDDHKHVEAGE